MVGVAVIMVEDWKAATLAVLGLSVLERNIRLLIDLGFKPVFAEIPRVPACLDRLPVASEISEPHLKIRGDVQYSAQFLKTLKSQLAIYADRNHDYLSPSGSHAPVQWIVSSSQAREFHQISDADFHDVPELIRVENPKFVAQRLAKAHFTEIFAATSGWIARGLNKKISFALTKRLVETKITPNQITVANFILGVAGCLMLLSPAWAWRVFGAALIQFNSILDGCDGEVAGLKVIRSKLGAWLDTISDDVLNNLMFVCVYLGVYFDYREAWLIKVCVATTFASFGVSFFIYHFLITHGTQNAAHYRLSWEKPVANGSAKKTWFDAVKPVLKRDFFVFLSALLIVLDLRHALLGLFIPIWIAFFLYLASFLYGMRRSKTEGP